LEAYRSAGASGAATVSCAGASASEGAATVAGGVGRLACAWISGPREFGLLRPGGPPTGVKTYLERRALLGCTAAVLDGRAIVQQKRRHCWVQCLQGLQPAAGQRNAFEPFPRPRRSFGRELEPRRGTGGRGKGSGEQARRRAKEHSGRHQD
jgi:hypothetical protein